MSNVIEFELKAVKEKPSRKYRKGSKYDAVLDAFMEGAGKVSKVTIDGKDGNYIRTQLTKRIDSRELMAVATSVVNSECYLEKF